MRRKTFDQHKAVLISTVVIGLLQLVAIASADSAFQIKVDRGHPWRPPFGLDRVGRSIAVIVEADSQTDRARYVITAFWKGHDVGRQVVAFPDKAPYSARATFAELSSVDEIELTAERPNESKPVELARQTVAVPELEADALALPDRTINPVDLGTILVPAGWLLLGPGQSAKLELAAISRGEDLPRAQIKACYGSASEPAAISQIKLPIGVRTKLDMTVPAPRHNSDRDELSVVIDDGLGRVLWRKTIPVMLVREPPRRVPFGATYERLRYDAPISVRQAGTGKFSSLKYEDAWKPELRDVVVWLPGGGRFVFWRGSSYIPFWAGLHNTGACYEWAEMITRAEGAVNCVEPLMDKELRYGRVEIVESTAARVHVRWRYQSTDFEYKIWGDETVEDYYFYPDGFGTRVVNLKADPKNDYELSEFIILTPQGEYPLDVLPESPVDALYLSGRVHRVRLPGPLAKAGENAEKLPGGEPAIYRLRLNKRDEPAAVWFSPQENAQPPFVFGPFFDGRLLVTPCYWGSHWPLARGNSTGNAIDDRIGFTPCHNSVMTWANRRPEPIETATRATLDSLGRSRMMTLRRWAWLIGTTDENDDRLLEWAKSYATPPALEVRGGRLEFQAYAIERRAFRLAVDERDVRIKIKPATPCVNPVFEITGAPRGGIAVKLGNEVLAERRFAWDGHTLWLDATIKAPAELCVTFGLGRVERPREGEPGVMKGWSRRRVRFLPEFSPRSAMRCAFFPPLRRGDTGGWRRVFPAGRRGFHPHPPVPPLRKGGKTLADAAQHKRDTGAGAGSDGASYCDGRLGRSLALPKKARRRRRITFDDVGATLMTSRSCAVAVCALLIWGARVLGDEPGGAKRDTFWVIPHTHWEGAVFKTREEYLEMGLPNIVKAMRLLREQPGYRFTLDQVAYVRPFLERFPALEADFRRFLAEGRLQLAGALDVMPDDNMPGGETFIRQMQYGKGYYRDKLGVDVTSGWLIDTFGHHAQLPQLMAKGGYKTFWFVRGVPRQEHPAEFLWEGIDGTRIPAFYLPHSYGILFGAPHDAAKFRSWAIERFNLLNPNAHGPHRVGLSGVDVSEPEEHLLARIKEFHRDDKAPFVMKIAVPSDYEAAVAGRTDLPVFKGELNPIFQGIYSSRIELKGWMRLLEQKLLTAEKLSAIATLPGSPADAASLLDTWEPVLFNETHDLASGVMTDHVYDDTVRSYEFTNRRADSIINAKWDELAAKIDTRGSNCPVLVFNTLGWRRTDVAYADVGFDEQGVTGVDLTGPRGDKVPAQLVESTRYADGGLKTARVAFLARDVPALGYSVYHVLPTRTAEGGDQPSTAVQSRLENDLYRVTIEPDTGAIASLFFKPAKWEVLSAHGNVVARQQDRGDLWELNRGLDGGSRVAMTTRQPVPKRGEAVFSDDGKGEAGTVFVGPVFAEYRVAPAFDSGRFATTVRVYHGIRRIEVTTRLVNREKYVRYQVLFPTTIHGGKSTHEIPFGAIERPAAIEFPAQNWVDYSDGARGLAILNVGLPGNVVSDDTMMVSLLRHTRSAPTASAVDTSQECRRTAAFSSVGSARCVTLWFRMKATGALPGSFVTGGNSTIRSSAALCHRIAARCPSSGACSKSPVPTRSSHP